MSLLMEALRKAEEAKKKAEQENEAAEVAEAAGNKPAKLVPPASPASQETPAFEYPRLNTKRSTSIEHHDFDQPERSLDVPIEFAEDEDSPAEDAEQQPLTDATQEAAGSASSGSGLALEQHERRDEVTEEGHLGLPSNSVVSTDNVSLDDSIARAANALDTGFNATGASATLEPEPAQIERDSQSEIHSAEAGADYSVQSVEQSGSAATMVSEPPGGKNPALEEKPSIKARSSSNQRSARSLFAVKRGQKPNQLVLLATAGVVVLLLGGGALVMMNSGGGSGITAPPVGYSPSSLQENAVLDAEVADGEVEVATLTTNSNPVDASDGQQTIAAAFTPSAEALEFDELEQGEAAASAADVEPVDVAGAAAIDTDSSASTEPAAAPAADQITSSAAASLGSSVSQAAAANGSDRAPLAFADDPNTGDSVSPAGSISFTRAGERDRLLAELNQAYAAFNRGDYGAARNLYQQALVNAPRNKDVLLGLAALDVREGNRNGALELYSRVLSLDPSDAVARAGILTTMPGGSAAEQERAFQRLLNQQQELATLHFAFANFLARQGRWTDAQQSYFTALRLAKSQSAAGAINPDYSFNLAISLERINQPALARDYYEEALAMASSTPASFDLAIARSRMNALTAGVADE